LSVLIHVPFKFEFAGSQVIFFDLEEDYSAEEKARTHQLIQGFRELADREL
jgi:D-glycero-alpha-D-manno-heptose-7-phosphate kinase